MLRQGLLSVALLGVALSAAEEACTTLLTPVTRYGKEGEGPGEINTAFHAVGAAGTRCVSTFGTIGSKCSPSTASSTRPSAARAPRRAG